MMLILSINNETHEVRLRHEDGTESTFVVPESDRYPSKKKLAYIKNQVRPARVKRPWLLYLAIAEAVVIAVLLIKVL